jgi:chemotaxis methyl-accepting protein methylase
MNSLPTVAITTHQEFALFQRLIYKMAGISLSDAKQVLLVGRLSRRLKQYGLSTLRRVLPHARPPATSPGTADRWSIC